MPSNSLDDHVSWDIQLLACLYVTYQELRAFATTIQHLGLLLDTVDNDTYLPNLDGVVIHEFDATSSKDQAALAVVRDARDYNDSSGAQLHNKSTRCANNHRRMMHHCHKLCATCRRPHRTAEANNDPRGVHTKQSRTLKVTSRAGRASVHVPSHAAPWVHGEVHKAPGRL